MAAGSNHDIAVNPENLQCAVMLLNVLDSELAYTGEKGAFPQSKGDMKLDAERLYTSLCLIEQSLKSLVERTRDDLTNIKVSFEQTEDEIISAMASLGLIPQP
jgi:hypothetical protein